MDAKSVFLFDKPLIIALALLFGAINGMPERKRRTDVLNSYLPELENELAEDKLVEVGCGCSISFDTTGETTIVYVKAIGEVDIVSLLRTLRKHYPGAKIEGLTSCAPVRLKAKNGEKPRRKKSKK